MFNRGLFLSSLVGVLIFVLVTIFQKLLAGNAIVVYELMLPLFAGALTGLFVGAILTDCQRKIVDLTDKYERLSMIAESNPDAITLKDVNGVYQYANDQFCHFNDFTIDQVIGSTDYDLFPKSMATTYRKEDEKVINTKTPIYQDELISTDDEEMWGRTSKVPVLDKDNHVIAVLITVKNITQQKENELTLKAVRAELEQKVSDRTKELIEIERELESIIENIPSMVFVKDARDLRFVRFNKAGEKLLGISREEMIGYNDYDFFPIEQADFFTQKDREVLQSDEVVDIAQEPIETPNGEKILHTRKVCIKDKEDKPAYLLGISEDITQQVKAYAELQQYNEMNKLIISTSHDGYVVINTSGKILDVNERYCEMSGYSKDELLSMSVMDVEAYENSEETKEHIQKLIEHGNDLFTTLHRRKNGEEWKVQVSASYSPIHGGRIVTFFKDLTE